jgi:general secretion pathway protein A
MSLYLKHFGLTREPFSIVPDPGFLYPSVYHRQAVAHLKYGLDREGGFILLTGEVGTGKTTLTRTMLKRLPAHVRVAYILNSKLKTTDVLASICHELAIELPESSGLSFSKICIDALNQNLLQAHAEGKKTLIVIEEAQNLTAEVLETLRLLSNLETYSHKLLHILLVGQPELLAILAQKELRQLNQRVVSRFHLLPIDKEDLANYVNHRLHRAGAKGPIFDRASIHTLFKLTDGVPRLVNLICQHALLAAYSNESKQVTSGLVKQAAVESLGGVNTPRQQSQAWRYWALFTGCVLAVGLYALQLPKQLNSVWPAVTAKSQSVAESVAEPAVRLAPSNPYANLLKYWDVPADEIYSEEELVALAARYGLSAEQLNYARLTDIQRINRPGIVRLKDQTGILKSAVLSHIDPSEVSLMQSNKTLRLDTQSFTDRWSGSYLYLWRPPLQIKQLKLGDKNPAALAWLQQRLTMVDPDAETIISAGRYTPAVVEQVRRFQRQQNISADGVIGRETLMRLNQLTEQGIPLLSEEPS